jgi:SpoVK/Ycf46/Vps4 family AAA+-type ATPase
VDILAEDLNQLLRVLGGLTLEQARRALAFCVHEDGKLTGEDIKLILGQKSRIIREGGILDFIPIESNRYRLGGFERLKHWLCCTRVGFSGEARRFNLPSPRGILIVGVQGCGKSLAAKVIAREWQMPLLKLDAGRLFDKFIGESEKNFRKAIHLAESMAPAVLWIDEIEKGMAPAHRGEADGGLSRRLFGSFLTWLQEKDKEVFVVATANDLFILPPELTRKGRFDEVFFVDLPKAGERAEIFKIHLGLRRQSLEQFDLDLLVAATEGYSGAEIEQLIVASIYRALYEKTPLSNAILEAEIRRSIPLSVSRREEVQNLRTMAKDRFLGVS